MSNVYSLENLKSDLDKKYAPVELDLGGSSVVLSNMMRLGKEDRKKVADAVKDIFKDRTDTDEEVPDLLETIAVIFELVAEDGRGSALMDAIGDDVSLGTEILNIWIEATQVGEASNSPV